MKNQLMAGAAGMVLIAFLGCMIVGEAMHFLKSVEHTVVCFFESIFGDGCDTAPPPGEGSWVITGNALEGAYFLCQAKCVSTDPLNSYDPNDSRATLFPFDKATYFQDLQTNTPITGGLHSVDSVSFVQSIYQMSNNPLPTHPASAAAYWDAYSNGQVPGWTEIPNDGQPYNSPLPGDLVVWTGGDGHLGIVTSVYDGSGNYITATSSTPDPPTAGYAVIAQAGIPGNYILPLPKPGDLLHPVLDHMFKANFGSNGVLDSGIPNMTIAGFIRNYSLVTGGPGTPTASGGATANTTASYSGGAQTIVQAALNTVKHLTGSSVNVYDNNGDPALAAYLKTAPNIDLNQVQCVYLVLASYKVANVPLPDPSGNAVDFWGHYTNNQHPGWTTIPVGSAPPVPGDIVVMSGGSGNPPPGHVAVVVAVHTPTGGNNGFIVVAQANWPGNLTTPDLSVPEITMPGLHLGKITMLTNYTFDSSTLAGHTILGFIRNSAVQANTPPPGLNVSLPQGLNSPYLQVAQNAAARYGYNSTIFVRQINRESSLDPNSISNTQAAGIAQFEPGTAPSHCVRVDNSATPPSQPACLAHPCSQIGLHNPHSTYLCDERFDPNVSLDAAAQWMSQLYQGYLAGTDNSPAAQVEAYKEALAAYNCGGGCVANLKHTYGTAWLQHAPQQTQDYITNILSSSTLV
ncbi:MAG TPA: CHAP domain-containing protein [Ktedonosporobacter sp.]|nr:CHAP domain-containing protein [Ktedonosporobacter sp.]